MASFIENFFARSSEEVVVAVSADPTSLLKRKREFLELLTTQDLSGDPPPLAPGELRPVVSNRISDLAAGGIRLSPDVTSAALRDGDARGFTLDVRSLLLYAHSVAVPNPFQASLAIQGSLSQPRVFVQNDMSDREFLFGLEMLGQLAPLVQNSVVLLIESKIQETYEPSALNTLIAELIPEIAMRLVNQGIFSWSDQTDLNLRARTLAERFLRQDIYLSAEAETRLTRLLSCRAEAAALPALSTIRPDADRPGASRDPWLIDELVRLQLQGAGRIRLTDMVSIRDDDCFTVFRKDMAAAVHESAASDAQDLASQQVVVADEMRAAARRLQLETRRSTFLSATLGDAVSWAVGAIVGGALAGWTGALGGLAAKGAVDLIRKGPNRAERAMHAHYIELSKPPAEPTKSGQRRLLTER